MSINISGDFNTKNKEIDIVTRLLRDNGVYYKPIKKSSDSDNEDIIVEGLSDGRAITIEVKEESYSRIQKYNDLGMDYISAFVFKNKIDEYKWKGSPKNPEEIENFESVITIFKPGKIFYSKADIWLFYCLNDDQLIFADWFLGEDMISIKFVEYLRSSCKFAVNNKPAAQESHYDKHQSATFFINRENPILISLKKNIKDIF
ncbi:MAG: hypothetical protein K9L02_07800 [Acholeplasmataceae bacterium]|nr:hypothetical protein [Acholeplasmataceae bacterium]